MYNKICVILSVLFMVAGLYMFFRSGVLTVIMLERWAAELVQGMPMLFGCILIVGGIVFFLLAVTKHDDPNDFDEP